METASVSHDEEHQHAVISFADGLIEKMKAAGINVSTDWQEGERVLAQENGRVSMMGSTTRKRQQKIGDYLNEYDLDENQKKIVDAFSGKADGDIVTLKDSKGKDRHVVLIQGNDNGVGIKHSVFKHFGTRRGVYVAEDILKIPQVVEIGERKQNGNRISYSAYISDKKLTLITEKTSECKEEFVNYFSNKKIEKQRDYNAPQALPGDTELTARAANVLNSAAKVRQNSEITKLSSKKELPPVTPLGTNRRGISKAAQTILAPRPFLSQRKINQLSCQAREPHRSTKRKAHQPTFPICASSSSCSTSSRCCRKSASCSLSQMFMLSFFIIQSGKPYRILIPSL